MIPINQQEDHQQEETDPAEQIDFRHKQNINNNQEYILNNLNLNNKNEKINSNNYEHDHTEFINNFDYSEHDISDDMSNKSYLIDGKFPSVYFPKYRPQPAHPARFLNLQNEIYKMRY